MSRKLIIPLTLYGVGYGLTRIFWSDIGAIGAITLGAASVVVGQFVIYIINKILHSVRNKSDKSQNLEGTSNNIDREYKNYENLADYNNKNRLTNLDPVVFGGWLYLIP